MRYVSFLGVVFMPHLVQYLHLLTSLTGIYKKTKEELPNIESLHVCTTDGVGAVGTRVSQSQKMRLM